MRKCDVIYSSLFYDIIFKNVIDFDRYFGFIDRVCNKKYN